MEKVIRKVKKIAKDYGLKFDKRMFRANVIDKKDYWLLMFLEGAPVPWIKEFNNVKAKTSKEFIKFLSHKDYKKFNKFMTGCVVSRKNLLKSLKKIPNKEIRIKYINLAKSLKSFRDWSIIIAKPTNKIEKMTAEYTLCHEFLHALLFLNKIMIQNIKESYQIFDENLVTYLMYEDFIKKNVNKWILW